MFACENMKIKDLSVGSLKQAKQLMSVLSFYFCARFHLTSWCEAVCYVNVTPRPAGYCARRGSKNNTFLELPR